MGCQYSKAKEKRSTIIDVGVPTLFSNHKNITEWEKVDYKKRMTKNNIRFLNPSIYSRSL